MFFFGGKGATKAIAWKRWIATDKRWKRKVISLSSPDVLASRWPRRLINAGPSWLIGPKAMDKKQYDGRIAGYLDDFLAVAISAAAPAASATGAVSSLSHPWSKVVKKQRPFRFPHKNKFFKFLYFLSVFSYWPIFLLLLMHLSYNQRRCWTRFFESDLFSDSA